MFTAKKTKTFTSLNKVFVSLTKRMNFVFNSFT